MRIIDWSSDVCSSDLTDIGTWQVNGTGVPSLISGNLDLKEETGDSITIGAVVRPDMGSSLLSDLTVSVDFYDIKIKDAIGIVPGNAVRSEEHTSELQSLMRISYAVFCFK